MAHSPCRCPLGNQADSPLSNQPAHLPPPSCREDKYAKYGGEEYYGKDSYGSYDYGYESGKKVCLKEVSRDPEHKIDLENDAETQYSWR